ncbi:MAG: hypothetical protein ACRDUX_06245 [Mycobacterium sp.]
MRDGQSAALVVRGEAGVGKIVRAKTTMLYFELAQANSTLMSPRSSSWSCASSAFIPVTFGRVGFVTAGAVDVGSLDPWTDSGEVVGRLLFATLLVVVCLYLRVYPASAVFSGWADAGHLCFRRIIPIACTMAASVAVG